MIEVFKTNIKGKRAAKEITEVLMHRLGYEKVCIDLDDCDRILRIESSLISQVSVIKVLDKLGYTCEVLPD